MATDVEVTWLEIIAPLSPRFIESEGKWAVAYDNEFDREIERFGTQQEATAFCAELRTRPAKENEGRG